MRRVQKRKSAWKSILRLMKIFANGILFMITFNSLLISFLTVTATFVCSQAVLNIRYSVCSVGCGFHLNVTKSIHSFKTSFEVFSFGTIFPLAFGIKTAFQNRERAAGALSRIKATVLSLFLVFQVYAFRTVL